MSDISRRAGFGHVEIKDPHDLVACKVQWVGEHCRRHLGLGMITLIKTANTWKPLNIFFSHYKVFYSLQDMFLHS